MVTALTSFALILLAFVLVTVMGPLAGGVVWLIAFLLTYGAAKAIMHRTDPMRAYNAEHRASRHRP